MADGVDISIENLPQFEAMMKDLGEGAAIEKVERKAMRAGGSIIQAAIIAAAPVRTNLPSGTALPPGAVKSDILLNVVKEPDASISAIVRPGKLTLHVVRWLEYGHELIVGGRKGKGGVNKGRVEAINAGQGFVRVSFEGSEAEAVAAIEKVLAAALTQAATEYQAAG
jgi:hypothetical protein